MLHWQELQEKEHKMPLTKKGKEVMRSMVKQYGLKKAKEVFYSSINKGKAGSSKWHGK